MSDEAKVHAITAPLAEHEEMGRWKRLPVWAQQELEKWRVDEAHQRGRAESAEARIRELEAERDEAPHWEDVDDEWTKTISAAHPTRGGSHENYATAMRMVGHRHSKGQLVSLVSWLLTEKGALESACERGREKIQQVNADKAAHQIWAAERVGALESALERMCNFFCNGSTRPGPTEGDEVFADAMHVLPEEARRRVNRGEPETENLRIRVGTLEEALRDISEWAFYDELSHEEMQAIARAALAGAASEGEAK